jgi:hypothetical protein
MSHRCGAADEPPLVAQGKGAARIGLGRELERRPCSRRRSLNTVFLSWIVAVTVIMVLAKHWLYQALSLQPGPLLTHLAFTTTL